MNIFAERIAAAPRNPSGSVRWVTMSTDEIAGVYSAAVAEGDRRLAALASAALRRTFLREIKAGKHRPTWANGAPYFGPMLDEEGNA
jgi:hypothetical protein